MAKPLGGAAAVHKQGAMTSEELIYETIWPASAPYGAIKPVQGAAVVGLTLSTVLGDASNAATAALAALQSASLESLGGCEIEQCGGLSP